MRSRSFRISLLIVLPKLLVLLVLLAGRVAAQEEKRLPMDIEKAVSYGLEHHKGIDADRQQINAAAGKLKQAGLKANPMLESSALTSITDSGMQNGLIGVTLPLELGRRERRVTLAERETEMKRHEVADRERMLAAEIRLKFAEVLETRETLSLSREIVEFNHEIQKLVGARVAEGISARLEENMQMIELRRSEGRASGLESRLRSLIEELKGLLGMPAEAELLVEGDLPTRSPGPTSGVEAPLGEAMLNRPDLRAALAAEEVGEAMIAMARTEGRFDVSIFGELGWQRWAFDQLGQMDNRLVPIGMVNGMIRGGVNIMLPIRNRNQGNIEAAAAYRNEARLRREFVQSMIYREVRTAQERIAGAQRVLQTFDNQLIESQQKNYGIIRASFELGHARLTDLLGEQRRLSELRMEQTMAKRELLVARIELARAVAGALNR